LRIQLRWPLAHERILDKVPALDLARSHGKLECIFYEHRFKYLRPTQYPAMQLHYAE